MQGAGWEGQGLVSVPASCKAWGPLSMSGVDLTSEGDPWGTMDLARFKVVTLCVKPLRY